MSVAFVDGPTVIDFVNDDTLFSKWICDKFRSLDSNNDGVLSRDELQKREGKFSLNEYELQSNEEISSVYDILFDKFDVDRSGTIDMEEFRSLMKELLFAKARGIGDLPVCIILQGDSLLMGAVLRANNNINNNINA